MSRAVVGSKWRECPLIVKALLLPTRPNPHIHVCDTCGASWEPGTFADPDCHWCLKRQQANHDYILKPPAPRGYGYATDQDLKALGYNRELDRQADLERWRTDLQLAADAGLITEAEGEQAWQSAKNHHHTSPSSTGTTSTSTSTKTTPSSTASPYADVGPPSPRARKPANRRSSSAWWWTPPGTEQQ